jgi:hypothetical protein
MIVQMLKEFGSRLGGKLPGKKDYARLCERLSEASPGSVVFLDFAGVEIVSGSWINAALVPLRAWAADERNDLFPVICNATEEMVDELGLVAKYTHTCFVVAEGPIPSHRAALIGPLDLGQRSTLMALVELQAVTGAELERSRPGEKIKATAWNNRLKDLFEKRLLRRERRGREQVYSPVVEEISVNG